MVCLLPVLWENAYVWGGSPAVIAACERHAAQLSISMEGGIRVWTPVRPALENRDVMPWAGDVKRFSNSKGVSQSTRRATYS